MFEKNNATQQQTSFKTKLTDHSHDKSGIELSLFPPFHLRMNTTHNSNLKMESIAVTVPSQYLKVLVLEYYC